VPSCSNHYNVTHLRDQALLLIEVNVAVKRKALADVSMLGMVTATLGRPLGVVLGFMYFCFRYELALLEHSRFGALSRPASAFDVLMGCGWAREWRAQ
jgi:hypothetical protein